MIYLNGILTDEKAARIDPADRGLTLGDGLFETIAVRDGKIVALNQHLARLAKGINILSLPCDHDFANGLLRTMEANNLTEGSLRLTVTRGPAARGVRPPGMQTPTIMITAHQGLPDSTPVHAVVATSTRRNELSPLSRCKNLNYLDNVIAEQEAAKAGADMAILLNTKNSIAETTTANIFWVMDGTVFTPPVSDGALPGVRRAQVIDQLTAEEKSVTADEIKTADEVFITNALVIRALLVIDNQAVGSGDIGPVTQSLLK